MLVADLPVWAARYIGAEFEAHGRGPSFDCWGLGWAVWRDVFHITLPSYDAQYAASLNRHEIARLIGGELDPWRWVPTEDAREGDAVLFLIAGEPCHCGIVVAPPRFLHSQRSTNVCIEDWTRPKWASRMAGIFRHESMA